MNQAEAHPDPCPTGFDCSVGIDHCEFLLIAGVTSAAWLAARLPVMGGDPVRNR